MIKSPKGEAFNCDDTIHSVKLSSWLAMNSLKKAGCCYYTPPWFESSLCHRRTLRQRWMTCEPPRQRPSKRKVKVLSWAWVTGHMTEASVFDSPAFAPAAFAPGSSARLLGLSG